MAVKPKKEVKPLVPELVVVEEKVKRKVGRPRKSVVELPEVKLKKKSKNVTRRVVKPKKTFNTIDPKTQELTIVNIGDDSQIYKLKNILPSGTFWFRDDSGKDISIPSNSEFEMTENELERSYKCDAFDNGHVIFMEIYEGYDQPCNCMSNNLILEKINDSYKKFQELIDMVDSDFTFNRIQKLVLDNKKPSEFYQYVELRKTNLAEIRVKASQYMTDAEKNKLNIRD